MTTRITCVVLIVVLCVTKVLSRPGHHAVDYYDHPQYAFNYGVNDPHTGDQKQQSEVRDGDVVRGQYSLVEPDGSIRTVTYTADDVHGFQAEVHKTAPTIHAKAIVPVVAAPVPIVHKVHKVLPAIHPVPVHQHAYYSPHVVSKTSQITHHIPQHHHHAPAHHYGDYQHDLYDYGQYDIGQYGQYY